jgi:hypothetical protein
LAFSPAPVGAIELLGGFPVVSKQVRIAMAKSLEIFSWNNPSY